MSPTLTGLVDAVATDPAVVEAVRRARLTGTAQATEALDVTAPSSYYPMLLASLADAGPHAADRPVLAVTA